MNLLETLNIDFKLEENTFTASIPITQYYSQPQGYVIGGIYILLAESTAGHASNLLGEKNEKKYFAVGQNINATHIRPKKSDSGMITAKGTLIHKGKSTHLWDVKIIDENNKTLSVISVQNFIVPL